MPGTYVDSSAIVKLASAETESPALRTYLRRRQRLFSSALARAEVLRALQDEGDEGLARGRVVLGRIDLIRVNDRILNAAGTLPPADLRTLDAIHLATALQLGSDVGQVVTYDTRMAEAATTLGLQVASP